MPPLLVPLLSSALPTVIAIAIPGVIVVLVVAMFVVAAHVVIKQQYPGCCSIEQQAAYGLAGEVHAEGSP